MRPIHYYFQKIKNIHPFALFSGGILTVIALILIYQFIEIYKLKTQINFVNEELASTKIALTNQLSEKFTDLNKKTVGLSETITNAQQNIDAVKNQVGGVEQKVGSISGTVGDLKKLADTDPQLLKKYSKVYFLNENYTPIHLAEIPIEYLYSSSRKEQFSSESLPYLKNLLDSAKANNITVYVKSGYRSYTEQKSLKTTYSVIYGAGTANAFSADQGYSEHQLGTTIDFITLGLGGKLEGFDNTASYEWLSNNAHNFGFVLSYPKGNNYYVYEPWHWRFVGIKLATYLHDNKLNFYDLDQRVIDKFLVNFYD